MTRSVTRYLTEAARKPGRFTAMRGSEEMSLPVQRSTVLAMVGLAAVICGAMAGYYFGPELARYIKMSRM